MKLDQTVKPELEWIGRERSYTIHEDENDGATFPDGSRVTTCTSWAIQARRLLGERAEIFGFFVDENEEATAMARLADGHDFVLVDGRYILDGWLCELEGDLDYPIVDIQDPANEDLVRSYYGDPECWTRTSGLEKDIDNEAPEMRAQALDGVAIPSPSEEPAQAPPKSLTQEDRIAEVNAVIDAMARHGRRFFHNEPTGRTARFEMDDKRRVMFRDD